VVWLLGESQPACLTSASALLIVVDLSITSVNLLSRPQYTAIVGTIGQRPLAANINRLLPSADRLWLAHEPENWGFFGA
jgi:hypothetical protein